MCMYGKLLRGRKDTFAHAASALRGRAPPLPPRFRRLCPNLLAGQKACPRKVEERMEWVGRKRKALSECITSWAAALTTNQPILRCKLQFARNGQFSEFQIFAPQNAVPWKVPPGANAPLAPPPSRRHCARLNCRGGVCVLFLGRGGCFTVGGWTTMPVRK